MVVGTGRRAVTVSVIESSFVAGGPVPPVRQLLERAAAVSTPPTTFFPRGARGRVDPSAGPRQKRVGSGRPGRRRPARAAARPSRVSGRRGARSRLRGAALSGSRADDCAAARRLTGTGQTAGTEHQGGGDHEQGGHEYV